MTNEAHNGYIEVYLNLGWLGLGLIALILGQGYGRAVGVFRRDSALGALLVAYVVTAVFYNYSEAGFRILSLEWFCLLLSVVAANRVISLAQTAPESGRELADPDRPPGQLGCPRTHLGGMPCLLVRPQGTGDAPYSSTEKGLLIL